MIIRTTTTARHAEKTSHTPTGETTMFAPGPLAPPMPTMPAIPQVKHTPLPDDQKAALAMPWDPFNQVQHAASMNQWLMGQIENANAAKIAHYTRAWNDWAANAQRYADLHMEVPQPPPLPSLQDVAPMPVGYWFGRA